MRIVSLAACLCAAFVLQSPVSAQAPTAVRIGILNDQSGPYADFGGKISVTAAQMAIEDFGGKVLGQPVEIVVGDHQNKPDVAAGTARRWFDIENVSAIADLTNSAVALAVQKIANDAGKITLAVGPATTRLTFALVEGLRRIVRCDGPQDLVVIPRRFRFVRLFHLDE